MEFRGRNYSQLWDMVAPLKPLLSSKSQFYWTNDLDESFSSSKQAIVDAIKHGVEIFDPARPTKLHTDYSKQGLGFYLAQKHCACTELDPSCCDSGWRITLSGSRCLTARDTLYTIGGRMSQCSLGIETNKILHFRLP